MLTDERIWILWGHAVNSPGATTETFARAVEREARRDALEEMRNECLSAQDWTDGSLGWNRACARMEAACRMLIEEPPC